MGASKSGMRRPLLLVRQLLNHRRRFRHGAVGNQGQGQQPQAARACLELAGGPRPGQGFGCPVSGAQGLTGLLAQLPGLSPPGA